MNNIFKSVAMARLEGRKIAEPDMVERICSAIRDPDSVCPVYAGFGKCPKDAFVSPDSSGIGCYTTCERIRIDQYDFLRFGIKSKSDFWEAHRMIRIETDEDI